MRENTNLLNKLDWATIGIYLLLVFIGWISIYAAVYDEAHSSILDISQRYGKQLLWIAAGILIAITILLIDSKFYSVLAYILYTGILLLLLLVLGIGTEVNGSRSWLIMGPVRLQPAELAKVATALALAKCMSRQDFKMGGLIDFFKALSVVCLPLLFGPLAALRWGGTRGNWFNSFKLLLLIGLPVGLIFLQHDTGSALVFGAFLLMFYREGLSGWVVGAILFAVFVFIFSILWQPVSVLMLCAIVSLTVFTIQRRKISHTLFTALCIFAPYFAITRLLLPEIGITTIPLDYIFLAISLVIVVWAGVYAVRHKLKYVWYILIFFIGSVALAYSVDYVFDRVLKPHQRDRIENLLGIKEDLQGAGYNVHQSMVAIGSGGLSGKGFLQGTQTKYNFVPEQSTDFIFCTIGEEWGFMGTVVVIVAYLLLLIRLVIISERQKDPFARIYGYCVISILFFHFAINIGMTIGLAPVVGIPLPFISYGGSSLWAFTILLFILLKLDAVRWD